MKQNIEIISQPRNFGQEEGTWAIPAELALEINLGKQVVILGWVSLFLLMQKRGKIFCKRIFTKLESWFTVQGGGNRDLSGFILTNSSVDYSLCYFFEQSRTWMLAYFYYSRLQWNQARNHKFPTRGRSGLHSCIYKLFGSMNHKYLLDTLFFLKIKIKKGN